MNLIKTSEKVLIWLHRENMSQKALADKLGQTRQSVSNKIKENCFTIGDMIKLKMLGFNE